MKQRDLDLIWRYTHPDFRGEMYGIRYVLHYAGSFGTCNVPLESLPRPREPLSAFRSIQGRPTFGYRQ